MTREAKVRAPEPTGSVRTLALGRRTALFYQSISHVLHHLGVAAFRDENQLGSGEEIVDLVRVGGFDRVLMPNPYGNPRRLACYRALRHAGITVVASDRGALPRSWFFDRGFNADSESYSPDQWDRPLARESVGAVREYIKSLRSSDAALEIQGARCAPQSLREQLSLGDARVLFIPLQRPADAAVRHFAGPVGSIAGLVTFAEEVVDTLEREQPGRWVVIMKTHPLENDIIRSTHSRVRYADATTHVHDLLELADAVLVLNSGVGLLSLCFGKPTIHLGEAFYGQPGLAIHASTPREAADVIRRGHTAESEKVERFIHHLTKRVYSFATSETELRVVADGSKQRVTTHLEFDSLRVLGEEIIASGDRVVVVSSVNPCRGRRGSETRVDAVIRALLAQGKRVSLVILDDGDARSSADGIAAELRAAYRSLDGVEVEVHPKVDPSARRRAARIAFRLFDVLSGGTSQVYNFESCPTGLRRRVADVCATSKPHFLLVNYAKLAPVVPARFRGIAVLDTHDYQTRLLEEDQRRNRRLCVSHMLFRRSERLALRRFDRIIAINPCERAAFEAMAPRKPVYFVPAFSEGSKRHGDAPSEQPYDALFVASRSAFNVDGLRWFIEHVLPLVRERRPTFELIVAGNISSLRSMRHARVEGVTFIGVVAELDALYESSRCVIAPLLGGAGMKIKVVEALAQGKAVIATSAALEGIQGTDGVHVVVADTPSAFATSISGVLDDASLRAKLERGARNLHARDHSPAAVAATIATVFDR